MRPIEIMVVLAALPPVLGLLSADRTYGPWVHLLPFLALFVCLTQLCVEGYRWQMLPVYMQIAFLLLYEASHWTRSGSASFVVGMGALVLWLAAVMLSSVLPVFEFPLPTGPFWVGTEVRHFVDLTRRETLSRNSSDPRELMVQIWYPANPALDAQFAHYREKLTTTWRTAQLALVRTHAYVSAPVSSAQRKYPVLIFSPSWSGQRVQNTFQVEELASQGYVIVTMDHPYGTDVTVFPDGRIVRTRLGAGEDYSSQAAFEEFVREAEQQVKVRAEDAKFVMDELDELNRRDPQGVFTGRLDLERVGIFGHSFGGSVAVQACWLDARFKAGMDMDGMLAGESALEGSSRPIFFMMEDESLPSKAELPSLNPRQRRAAEFGYAQTAMIEASLAKSGGYRMVLQGTTHRNFSDSPFFSPLKFLTGAGPISTDRAAQVINKYTLAFFDQTLKGQSEPLLTGLSRDFPEARMEVWSMHGQTNQNRSAAGLAQPMGIPAPVDILNNEGGGAQTWQQW